MKKKIKIIVNILTLSRIIGAILFPIILPFVNSLVGIILFVLLLATDAIDGFLARKFSVCTKGGFHLDQFCDKVLGIIALLCLIKIHHTLIIPLVFEICIALVNIVRATNNKSGSSSIVGKIKTFTFSITLILVTLKILAIPVVNNTIINISVAVTGILELIALTGYIIDALREKCEDNDQKTYKEKIETISDVKRVVSRLWNEEMFTKDKDKSIQLVIEEELREVHKK